MSDDSEKKIVPPAPPRPEESASAQPKMQPSAPSRLDQVADVVAKATQPDAPQVQPKMQPPAPAAPPASAPAQPSASPAPASQAAPSVPTQPAVPQSSAPAPQSPAPAPAAPKPAASQPAAPAPAAPVASAPPVSTPAPQAMSGTMDKVSMPSDLKAPDGMSPSAAASKIASVKDEFFAGDGVSPSGEMPKVSSPDISMQDGSSLNADVKPKMRSGFGKVLLLLLLLAGCAAAAFFFLFSGDDAPKKRPLLPAPNEGRIERPKPPIPEPVVVAPPAPTESIYIKQCRDHFNSSIAARGEDPAAYGAQGDAYVENCAKSLEAQAAGGAQ